MTFFRVGNVTHYMPKNGPGKLLGWVQALKID